MKIKTRYVADALIGIMTATSTIWDDVNALHRIAIAVLVTFAVETLLVMLDDIFERKENQKIIDFEAERKQRNRDQIYEEWKKEMH